MCFKMTIFKVWMVVLSTSLLLLSCFGLEPNQIYHITPTSSYPCPLTPCLTLSQFAKNQSTRISTILVFLPGKHSLGWKLSVTDIPKFSMISKQTNDSNIEITCHQYGGLHFTDVPAVHIKHLDFIGCVGNQVKNVGNFILEDSNFIGEEDIRTRGAALELYSTSIVISRSSFRFYRGSVQHGHTIGCAYKDLSIETGVPNTERYRIGGALFSINSSTTILDSRFEGNSAYVGGAIFAECYSNVTVINSVFINNYVSADTSINLSIKKCSGGGVLFAGNSVEVTIHGSQFHQNIAYKDLSGGVLMAGLDTVINISASHFMNNSAKSSYGGGVLFITDSHSTSNLNTALIEGEEMDTHHDNKTNLMSYDCDGVRVTITNSWFVNNSVSAYGGVIKVDAKLSHIYQISITDSKFFRNSALISGGVIDIYAANDSILNIASSDFISNSAGTNGGVIHSDRAFVTISGGSKFEHNTALNNGGVITNCQGSLKIVDKCEFNHNKAYNNGGAIHAYQGTISISKGNNFNKNIAHNDGGAIYAFESFLNISRANIFDNNTANNGAAISAYEGNLTVSYRNIFSKNIAHKDGGAIFAYVSNTRISEENIFSRNMALNNGGAVHVYQQELDISETRFQHNKANNDGGTIWAHEANTMTTQNYYDHNYAGNRGGVWNVYNGWHNVSKSSLSHNEATDGGAIFADMAFITVVNTTLVGNRASTGGALHTYQSDMFFVGSKFSKNFAEKYGGGWYMREGNASVTNSVFEQNSASDQGGAWYMDYSSVVLEEIVITGSSANIGAALYATGCTLNAFNSLLITGNTAHTMGTFYLSHGSFKFHGETEFSKNYGSLVMFNNNATFLDTTRVVNCSEPMKSHERFDVKYQEGGGLTLFKSHVIFGKRTILRLLYNHAKVGGAIHAAESKVYVYGDTLIANNNADNTGGGLHLFQSEINCQQNCLFKLLGNEAVEKGGGMIAINSTLNMEINVNYIDKSNVTAYSAGSVLYFIDNKAAKGGGLYLDVFAKLYVKTLIPYSKPHKLISFIHNEAKEHGGAVYLSYCSGTGICLRPTKVDFIKECSIQTLAAHGTSSTDFTCKCTLSKSIFFHENSAKISGSSLFQEVIRKRCNIGVFDEQRCTSPLSVNRNAYFHTISNINNEDIGSQAVRLCFCKHGRKDCANSQGPRFINVLKGDEVSFEVVALDQVGHPVNAILSSYLHGSRRRLYLEDLKINGTCTAIQFNISSPNDNEALKMLVKGTSAKKSVNIHFTTCDSCPIGFIMTVDENGICKCDCDPQLEPYITVCNASQETLTREGDFWITYMNTSDNASSGYLIYPFCPYNYCVPPTSTVEINLNFPDGADSQCANGHSGLLCGQCQSGLSLSLGSSRCLPCSTKWPIMLVAMLMGAFLAGIILVVLLMSINLSVAVGTLNSIIFYVNIVDANSSIFLPFSKPNFTTIFIAGLNLRTIFDTCFFEGTDAFWKTMLQLAFPLYVISLVVVIIFTSEHSTRFAKLMSKKNPVATLATLIFLSYSKQLQTIITSLSFATLQYPDGSHLTVWLPDADVEYLKGKHIVLFIIAILILLAGAVYTTFLFTWQWLLHYQDKILLRWMKYQKLCHFIEPYHAPYVFSQRYWFGLLLIARIPIYIVSAVTNNPRVKLLSTSAVIVCLLLAKLFSTEKQIYRKRQLDVLDTIMYTNIISFSALTWYTLDMQQTHAAVAYFSVSVTFTLLVCVVLYHAFRYTSLFSAIHKTKMSIAKLLALKSNLMASHMSRIPDDTSEFITIVTHSTVELSKSTFKTETDHAVSSDCNEPTVEAHSPSTCED